MAKGRGLLKNTGAKQNSPQYVDANFSDFTVENYLQEGGWGVVYSGVRKFDGQQVAIKFFGYTSAIPHLDDIIKEITLLNSLRNISGVSAMYGVFLDSAAGLLQDRPKIHRQPLPAIVMELLGEDVFTYITTTSNEKKTEALLARVFRSVIVALASIHAEGFVHRDLKLENLMLTAADPSVAKIIDLGEMVRLSEGQRVHTCTSRPPGSLGYFAPETLTNFENSFATDVFQAGVILYAMLSCNMPFEQDLEAVRPEEYRPMEGFAWEGRSAACKDLVAKMLARDPAVRITLPGILVHEWLQGGALNADLGSSYVTRIQHLVLKQKMKKFFLDHSKDHLHRRRSLESAVPSLGHISSDLTNREDTGTTRIGGTKRRRKSGFDFIYDEYDEVDEEESGEVLRMDYRSKLRALKERVLTACAPSRSRYMPPGSPLNDDEAESADRFSGKIDFDLFCELMDSSGLEDLARMAVFRIFDHDGDGAVNIQEFMVTLMAMQPLPESSEEEEDKARLYFEIFDIDGNGSIDSEELRTMLECVLHDYAEELSQVVSRGDMDKLFAQSGLGDRGAGVGAGSGPVQISFEQFKLFYESVLSTTQRTTSVSAASVLTHRTDRKTSKSCKSMEQSKVSTIGKEGRLNNENVPGRRGAGRKKGGRDALQKHSKGGNEGSLRRSKRLRAK